MANNERVATHQGWPLRGVPLNMYNCIQLSLTCLQYFHSEEEEEEEGVVLQEEEGAVLQEEEQEAELREEEQGVGLQAHCAYSGPPVGQRNKLKAPVIIN